MSRIQPAQTVKISAVVDIRRDSYRSRPRPELSKLLLCSSRSRRHSELPKRRSWCFRSRRGERRAVTVVLEQHGSTKVTSLPCRLVMSYPERESHRTKESPTPNVFATADSGSSSFARSCSFISPLRSARAYPVFCDLAPEPLRVARRKSRNRPAFPPCAKNNRNPTGVLRRLGLLGCRCYLRLRMPLHVLLAAVSPTSMTAQARALR